ncbi:MAG: hypothetical protein P4L53_20590 [Candidatus Obscuribacterales bacterium]|nr:hypothetical protein [Candidatus Obscuribacterales bacterium]
MSNYMTDQDRRWWELYRKADKLSAADVVKIEKQLKSEPANMDLRVQLFGYWYSQNFLKRKDTEQKLLEHVLWMIEYKPSVGGSIGHKCAMSAMRFTPRNFATARQAWLEQVDKHPINGVVVGNAGAFIAWNDFETGSHLLERAARLDQSAGWLQLLSIHCNDQIWRLPFLYKDEMREKLIDVGVRSLKNEGDIGAPFITAEYVAEVALTLGRYDLVKYCAQAIYDYNPPESVPVAKFYVSLLALREGDRRPALEMISQAKREELRQDMLFRLATALYELGERDSIVQMIVSLKGKAKEHSRRRWLEQMANSKPPDFLDACMCDSCR